MQIGNVNIEDEEEAEEDKIVAVFPAKSLKKTSTVSQMREKFTGKKAQLGLD